MLRFSQFAPNIMLKVYLILKLISWSDIAFDVNNDFSAMLPVFAVILKRLFHAEVLFPIT